jgi:hypothetical protein
MTIFDNHNDHQLQVSRALEYVLDETGELRPRPYLRLQRGDRGFVVPGLRWQFAIVDGAAWHPAQDRL